MNDRDEEKAAVIKNFIEIARIFAAVDNCNEIRKKKFHFPLGHSRGRGRLLWSASSGVSAQRVSRSLLTYKVNLIEPAAPIVYVALFEPRPI